MSPVYQPPSAAGGSVATDVIWDTKGDLAAATGADAAVKVPAGADGSALVADSASAAGVKYVIPIGTTMDYVEFTGDVSITATTEAAAITVVTGAGFTPNGTDSFFVQFSGQIQPAATAADKIVVVVYDNGSPLVAGNSGIAIIFTPAASTDVVSGLWQSNKITPTNASHTYSIRAYKGTNNGLVRGGSALGGVPGYIRVVKA